MSRNQIKFDMKDLKKINLKLKDVSIIARYYNVSESTIRKNLKQFNIPLSKMVRSRNRKSKFETNESLFETDTENSFYIAGFIAADGCVRNNTMSIHLSSRDRHHLEMINSRLESNRRIYDYNEASRLLVTSKKVVNDLMRFNIVPRKSLIYTFPEWMKTHPLKHHFMRGYFDGDGSFYVQTQYNKKICFGLRGTEQFLCDYRNILEQECGFHHRTYNIPISSGCGILAYGGNRNIIKILKFLYNNSNLFLQRKYKIALKAYYLYEGSL